MLRGIACFVHQLAINRVSSKTVRWKLNMLSTGLRTVVTVIGADTPEFQASAASTKRSPMQGFLLKGPPKKRAGTLEKRACKKLSPVLHKHALSTSLTPSRTMPQQYNMGLIHSHLLVCSTRSPALFPKLRELYSTNTPCRSRSSSGRNRQN